LENYWDNLQQRASINLICALDAEIVAKQQCFSVSCDKDFPADFRPKLWEIIKRDSLELPEGRVDSNIDHYKNTKKSKLIESLRVFWKDIAQSFCFTRFGILLDDPASALAARELWEKENEDFELKKQGEKRGII
jgi:hypothetical protein